MIVPQTEHDVISRLSVAENRDRARDALAQLCREVFGMDKERNSSYFGMGYNEWRTKVAEQYWQADNRGFNAVDLATAVLSGYSPNFKVTVPGLPNPKLSSRAEKFLGGVLRINSRRQQVDIFRSIVFNTALDAQVGIRIIWDSSNPKPTARTLLQVDDGVEGMVSTYADYDFPIVLQTVPITELHVLSRGKFGKPFDQIAHVDQRTGDDVINEWGNVEGASVQWIVDEYPAKARAENKNRYVEWWGEMAESDGTVTVYQAVLYNDRWVVPPRRTTYPCIPYVICSWKVVDDKKRNLYALPFLFSMLHASNRWEYLMSRSMRLIDMLSALPPILERESGQPINIGGPWGKVLSLNKGDKLYFPQWPGQTPDVYRLMELLRQQVDEGTFSSAMFGQMSPKAASGYALGQQIGADTIRLDNPRANIELALAGMADKIFQLMQRFAPQEFIAVTGSVKSKDLGAVLGGEETKALIVECSVRPKMTQDELRRAAIGAQLASLPKKVISVYRILQEYFDIEQPEEEIDRVALEQAEDDPLLRLMAISQVLHKTGSPWAAYIDNQLQAQLSKMGAPGAPGAVQPPESQPQGMDNLGMGVPQFTLGNAPMIPPTGNPQEGGEADIMGLLGGMPPGFGPQE